MERKIVSSVDVIEGYKTSPIARSETNDCVVRAVAVVRNCHYDEAHRLVKLRTGRQDRKGTSRRDLLTWLETHCEPVVTEQPVKLLRPYMFPKTVYTNKKTGERLFCKMTVGSFVKLYPKGRYYVCVQSHMFAVVDGEIVGNKSDATTLRAIVHFAMKHVQ